MKKLISLLLLCMVLCIGCGIVYGQTLKLPPYQKQGQRSHIFLYPQDSTAERKYRDSSTLYFDSDTVRISNEMDSIFTNQNILLTTPYTRATPTYDTIPCIILYIDTATYMKVKPSITDDYELEEYKDNSVHWANGYDVRKEFSSIDNWVFNYDPHKDYSNIEHITYLNANEQPLPYNLIVVLTK